LLLKIKVKLLRTKGKRRINLEKQLKQWLLLLLQRLKEDKDNEDNSLRVQRKLGKDRRKTQIMVEIKTFSTRKLE